MTRTFSGQLPGPGRVGYVAIRAGGEERFQRLEVHVHLALVVDRPARIQVSVALRWVKGGRKPFVQRVRRLHIIMAVTETSRLTLGVQPVAIDKRMATQLDEPDIFEADARHLCGQNLGGAADVASVFGKRGDAGNAEQSLQLVQEPAL